MQTLIIKSIQFVDFSVLMISSQQGDSLFVHDFQYQNVQECLNTIKPSIDIVSHKEVICCLNNWRITGGRPEISNISNKS